MRFFAINDETESYDKFMLVVKLTTDLRTELTKCPRSEQLIFSFKTEVSEMLDNWVFAEVLVAVRNLFHYM